MVGFAFGAADFAKDIGVWQPDNFSFLYPKSHLVITSSANAGQPPIDSVHANLNDERGLRESSIFAKNLGFFGRSAIHPKQVSIINEVYTPSKEEIEKAPPGHPGVNSMIYTLMDKIDNKKSIT